MSTALHSSMSPPRSYRSGRSQTSTVQQPFGLPTRRIFCGCRNILRSSGQLMLPRQRLAVADSAVQVHLERKLAAQAVHIQVWVNDQQFPDDIVVRIMT